jgi:hypothetical protein
LKFSYEAISKAVPADLTVQVKKAWEEFARQRAQPQQSKAKKPSEVSTENKGEGQPEERIEQNAGAWFKRFSAELVGPGGSSKVALARNYAFLSRDNDVKNGLDNKKVQQAKVLLEQIVTSLNLPSMKAKQAIET